MNTYLLLFVVALCSSLALTPLIRRACERFGWFDVPEDDRRIHTKPIPRLGGVAIFAAVLLALAILPFVNTVVAQIFQARSSTLLVVLLPATLMLLFGIYDDLRGASATTKFLVQGLAGVLLYVLGGRVESIWLPVFGLIDFHWTIDVLLTIFWTVGVTNAFNLIDGVDGLATGAALFAALVMVVVSLMNGDPFTTVIAVVLAGSLIGFLRYNFNPASIFLGDSGALFIGFTLAALSMQGMQKATTAAAVTIPLLAFGMPIVDTTFAMARRFVSGKPLFAGDREHIHHKLLERGWSQRRTVLVLYSVCALFSIFSLLLVGGEGRATGFVLLIVGVAIALAINSLRYHEVDELKASMKRNVTERRQRAANNICVRRASHAMSNAETLDELLSAVKTSLETGEFVCARVQIGGDVIPVQRENLLTGLHRDAGIHGAKMQDDGIIYWTWERDGDDTAEILDSGLYWALRMPLVTKDSNWGYINLYRAFKDEALLIDINYLCNFYQHDMAQAVERLMGNVENRASQAEDRALSLGMASGR